MLSLGITIVIIVLTVYMAVLPLFRDVMQNNDLVFNKPFIKRITKPGWSVIAAAIIVVILSVWKVSVDASDRKSEIQGVVSETIAHFDSALSKRNPNLSYDRVTNRVVSKDTIVIKYAQEQKQAQKQEEPFLELHVGNNSNPVVRKLNEGKYTFSMVIDNISNAIAFHTKEHFVVFKLDRGIIDKKSISRVYKVISNETSTVVKGVSILNEHTFAFINRNAADTAYFYYRIEFSDKDGKKQKPFRKIFYYTDELLNSSMPEVQDDEFKNIKKSLITNKMW